MAANREYSQMDNYVWNVLVPASGSYGLITGHVFETLLELSLNGWDNHLVKIVQQHHVISHDPLRSDFGRTARPAPVPVASSPGAVCAALKASVQAVCRGLGTAFATLGSAVDKVQSLVTALATTVGRESAARFAYDRGALAHPQATAVKLLSEIESAQRAPTSAALPPARATDLVSLLDAW